MSPSSGYCGSQVVRNSSGTAGQRLFADDSGNVYIAFTSFGSPLIERFSPSGSYVDLPSPGFAIGIFEPMYKQIWGTNGASVFRLDSNAKLLGGSSPPFAAGVVSDNSIAVDSAGNLWLGSVGGTLEEFTPSGSFQGGCTVTYVCGLPVISGNLEAMAIDPCGNIFVLNATTPTLTKITGLAGAP